MKLIQKKMLAVVLNSFDPLNANKYTVTDGTRGSFDTSEDDLNAAKGLMGDNAEGTKYKATKADVYKMLIKKVVNLNGQCVSNAWLKFMELFKFIEPYVCKDNLSVFMNAELPGSSICALNHFMKTRGINYEWIASSFVPEAGQSQLEDRYGLLGGCPENWLIGGTEINVSDCVKNNSADFNGNMTDSEQVKMCINLYKSRRNKCDLYTSDAGMDVSSDYARQEEMNFKLHLGCAIVGLSCLSSGGTLICKHYTFYRDDSRALLWYYQQFFKTVILTKPVTSRPYNSETYVIGLDFKMPENGETLLTEMYDLLSNSPAEAVIKIVAEAANEIGTNERFQMFHDIFVGRQIEFLHEKAEMDSTDAKVDVRLYDRACNLWLTNMGIKKIDTEDHLCCKK